MKRQAYRIMLSGAKPADLAERCAAVWADVLALSARLQVESRDTLNAPALEDHSDATTVARE